MDATTERVDVLKGSSSLLYGILNPGGVINLISKNHSISGRDASADGQTATAAVPVRLM